MMAAGGGRTSSSLHVSGTTEASVLLSPVQQCVVFTLLPLHWAFPHSAAALHRHTEHHTASHVTEIPPVICSFSLCFSSHHTWPDLGTVHGTRCLDPDIVQRRGWWSLYTAVSRLLPATIPSLLRDLTLWRQCCRLLLVRRMQRTCVLATCHVSPDERVGVKQDNLTTF